MRIAVCSDFHGNKYCLEPFKQSLNQQSIDLTVFCGDIFGYYYYANEIIETMKALNNFVWVRGNHDKNFLDLVDGKCEAAALIGKYGNAYHNIEDGMSCEDIQFVRSAAEHLSFVVGTKKIGVFHGTPAYPLIGRLYPKDEISAPEGYSPFDYVFLGHTHFRMDRFIQSTRIVNPGSIGQPRDRNGFGYAVVDTVADTVEFVNIYPDLACLEIEILRREPQVGNLIEILHRGE